MALWLAAWLVIAALLLVPFGIPPAPGRGDLLVHLLMFGGLALTALGFCRTPSALIVAALGTAVGGGTLEMAQGLVPSRFADPLDALANVLGAALGCALAIVLLRWRDARARG